MAEIDRYAVGSGRKLKEDSTVVNTADLIESIANTGVKLTGSIPEYGWVDGEAEPTPTEFAFGVKVDPATGAITTMYWDGTSWEEVE